MIIALFVVFLLISFSSQAALLTPHLSDEHLQRALQIRERKIYSHSPDLAEQEYQKLVQPQTLADLLEFYKPENEKSIQVLYASFTPESSVGGGHDLGFGLHVVKRLVRKLPDGTEKVTDINELWPEERNTSGLLLPDEIRIKTLSLPGKRGEPGSHKLYLFDSIRVAWGPQNDEVQIVRRSVYQGKKERQVRVGVSAPLSCFGCHEVMSGSNPEAISESSDFLLPPEEQPGFQEYMAYLKKKAKKPEFIAQVLEKLMDPVKAGRVPGIEKALEEVLKHKKLEFLGDDDPVVQGLELKYLMTRQGYYNTSDGKTFVDALENVIEGKYRWWEPLPVIP